MNEPNGLPYGAIRLSHALEGMADARSVDDSLAVMLEDAARTGDWQRGVVHRCAWCKRIRSTNGRRWLQRSVRQRVVVTDVMCEACGRRALAQLQLRRARPRLARAA